MALKIWKCSMPTYDYKCLECDHTFEEFQKITENPLEICPKCKGKIKRLIGPGAGPIFKGSGFYQTDYKSVPKDKDKKVPSKESKSTESTKSTSKDSKPKSGEA